VADTVVITGARTPLGRRVCALAAADPAVGRVVEVDDPARDATLAGRCAGAAAVVVLGAAGPGDGAGAGTTAGDVAGTRAALRAAEAGSVPTVVLLSSAMVYGAWPDNPVPLTEAAPLRPVPGLAFAAERAEMERLAGEWRRAGARTVALMRPATVVAPEVATVAAGLRIRDTEPPAQFVHVDDVAAAIDLARRGRLDGPANVAPDGWIPPEARRDLSGPAARVPLPAALAGPLVALRGRLDPTGVLPYRMHPWVVANDRLRAAGWVPAHTNEEAYVEAEPGGPLAKVDPRRRQLISLAALGAAGAALAGGVFAIARASRRR
jgi:nucleoside-diphosphate-sugar epimerase